MRRICFARLLPPGSGGYVRPSRSGGAAADEARKTQRAAEEAIEQADERRKTVSSSPGTVQKVVDGPQAPRARGPADAPVALSAVLARGVQRGKSWWRNR